MVVLESRLYNIQDITLIGSALWLISEAAKTLQDVKLTNIYINFSF